MVDDKLQVSTYSEGEFCVSEPMIPHNVYMYPDAVTHTVKFGDCSKADWIACEELDRLIKESFNI